MVFKRAQKGVEAVVRGLCNTTEVFTYTKMDMASGSRGILDDVFVSYPSTVKQCKGYIPHEPMLLLVVFHRTSP
jgi:hypothetical protein